MGRKHFGDAPDSKSGERGSIPRRSTATSIWLYHRRRPFRKAIGENPWTLKSQSPLSGWAEESKN